MPGSRNWVYSRYPATSFDGSGSFQNQNRRAVGAVAITDSALAHDGLLALSACAAMPAGELGSGNVELGVLERVAVGWRVRQLQRVCRVARLQRVVAKERDAGLMRDPETLWTGSEQVGGRPQRRRVHAQVIDVDPERERVLARPEVGHGVRDRVEVLSVQRGRLPDSVADRFCRRRRSYA